MLIYFIRVGAIEYKKGGNYMEYRSLTDTTTKCMHEAFLQAFSDYQVPMNLSLETFERKLKRNGFKPELSAGAFEHDRLVGFVLNGVREWTGEKTIYDTGTGVVPEFRGAGIGNRLLNLVNELCVRNNISVYQLEVIQDNVGAVSLYKKQGFQVKRSLNCYRLSEKLVGGSTNTRWKLYRAEKMDKGLWNLAKSFWEYIPSWQNGEDAVCAVEDAFGYTLVELEGALIGYGIVDKVTGEIAQLAVDCHYRRRGVATAILQDLQRQTQKSSLTVINVDERDESLNAFLKQMGFQVYVTQYEMVKAI